MRNPQRPPSDFFLLAVVFSAVALIAAAGCSRRTDTSAEDDSWEQDSRRTVASRDGRREIQAPAPAEEKAPPDSTSPAVGRADSPAGPRTPQEEPGELKPEPQQIDARAEIQKVAAQAARLVDAGLKLWDEAKEAVDKDERGVSDSLLVQAYQRLEQAHRLYEELRKREPDGPYEQELQNLEKNMGDLQRVIGSGDW